MSDRVDPHWGKPYGDTPFVRYSNGEDAWMYRKGQRVRFFDDEGHQIGPEHRNVAPAVVWASAHGWFVRESPLYPSLDPQMQAIWAANGGVLAENA